MKFHSRRPAAVVLAVAISISAPIGVAAAPQRTEHGGNVVVQIIKKLHRLFGIAVNDDLPLPPPPAPPPPPNP